MSNEEIIESIRGLVQIIPREAGIYASFSEGIEPGGNKLINVYLDEAKAPRLMQSAAFPQGDELGLKELHDELLEWVTNNRKQEAA